MKQLDLIELKPTRYSDPCQFIADYRIWFLANVNRKTDFVDAVDLLRTALVGRFYLYWMLADYYSDLAVIQSGKQLITTVLPG